MDRLTGLEIFVSAIRKRSLSAAARDMGMSPTMAARHLDALEARLGTTLVRRSTRSLSLTEAGTEYLEKAEHILSQLAEADAHASAETLNVEGLLRVSVPAVFGVLHVSPFLPAFNSLYPKVIVELGLNDRYVDLLDERWDTAIRVGHLSGNGLVARKLARVRLSVCGAPTYLKRRGVPSSIADLAHHDCLGYTLTARSGPGVWTFGPAGDIKVPVSGTLLANDGAALVAAALAGQGLVYGPRFIAAPHLASGRLVDIALDVPLRDLGSVHVVTHPTRRPAAKTRAWINFIDGQIKGHSKEW